ncbi:hypothetical protein [Hymenobacter terricola]|uniref:hypothetical protein n=1 Tax=Hymenobacter terricola TaxID=2819236 RepID=UPI001B30667A|nr:hypothetical protein [Hymenobacter terricola]
MREHNGMRPQEVVLVLKLPLPGSGLLHGKEPALALHLSAAGVSDSLRRCQYSRLMDGGPQPLVATFGVEPAWVWPSADGEVRGRQQLSKDPE